MTELTDLEPLWDRTGFAEFLRGLAQDDAPRLFAIAHEYGDRHDGWIAAYGMAFRDRAEVVSTEGDFRTSSASPEAALATFARFANAQNVKPHLVWLT
ncbi:hypothetical protein [Saccharothrix coeruleofusca]|uniref:Uncharacterized protein n=1 Tax=Saccharothrix coeruleofusca TaxID=33919 RepID=A0A918ATS3_9PSEU|nr:hypothetical protein [Saccharothrix coeruleofusca]MBP2338917.1 hypothetical protein [Saccharothrix coeruleofusca]GGP83110.1 hypothetical protein GCM10010185_66330 [Saccharothrix coeruleofusca]